MKRYKVTGSQPVLDHAPGESFDAALSDEQEQFLVGINAIKVVSTDVAHDKRIQSGDESGRHKAESGKKKG